MRSEDSRSDETIAADVREALRWDSRLTADTIRVDVLDGIVTLSGNVRLLAERNLAAADAWRVKGVRQVIDDLAVSPSAERTDADILADVENSLAFDHRVDAGDLVVQVADGVITLSGVVGSTTERQAAIEDAWFTPGVVAVADRLDVNGSRMRPESEILASVREAITRDARIADATRISVSVAGDQVTLSGGVDRPEERRAAQDDAWFTAGVRSVTNHLIISPLNPPA